MQKQALPTTLRLFKIILNKIVASNCRTLADLKIGEKGVIESLKDTEFSLQLMEMGCMPGYEIKMSGRAPFGGPIKFCICGYSLSVRREEARLIELKNEKIY